MKKNIGIKESEVKDYWHKRSTIQGNATVGFVGNSLSQQDNEYNEKINFVKKNINTNLKTLDYGCGIGRWSKCFNEYLGIDITNNLLKIAINENKNKDFILLDKPYITNYSDINNFNFEQFFTSTVLQHCDDNLVDKIFQNLFQIKQSDFDIFLYENSSVKAPHVNGRKPDTYHKIISKYFNIKLFEEFSHIVHNEEHSITKIKV